ncbi:hypothetical protein EDD27_4221 [Nonomuraea polychroma]|uniref:Uncharacterized protein n=1 Tax=Nonomuraea polychroma TaxID=46176 RepID=A0A438M7H5_9ACTN|nr:hypothetical protein [Nonomuraea polychroma]RVX41660.1 hypothetical protein EDD27_4221 [Nonomuraea polychroma]
MEVRHARWKRTWQCDIGVGSGGGRVRAQLARREQHASEAGRLREDLAAAEQLGDVRGRLAVAQAAAQTAWQQARRRLLYPDAAVAGPRITGTGG